jgi:hypothetical protein
MGSAGLVGGIKEGAQEQREPSPREPPRSRSELAEAIPVVGVTDIIAGIEALTGARVVIVIGTRVVPIDHERARIELPLSLFRQGAERRSFGASLNRAEDHRVSPLDLAREVGLSTRSIRRAAPRRAGLHGERKNFFA